MTDKTDSDNTQNFLHSTIVIIFCAVEITEMRCGHCLCVYDVQTIGEKTETLDKNQQNAIDVQSHPLQ